MKILCRAVLFFAVTTIFFTSCKKKDETNDKIIEREKFVELLSEVQVLESTYQFIHGRRPEFNPDLNYEWLFRDYQITEEEFLLSFDYYTSDFQVFEAIYDDVIIKISEKQAENNVKPGK